MDLILKKMNFKDGMAIQIWNGPIELNSLFETWEKEGLIAKPEQKPTFLIAFVQTEEDVRKFFPELHALSPEDEVLWMAYPKGSSKKYKSQINRDSGWKIVGEHDYEGVRQIAIDDDWSALRFRKLKFIKTLTRSFSTKNQ